MPPKKSPKKVDELSVKELKAELTEYGVDYAAAGCVEKSQLKDLLAKTRSERGWPPKQGSGKDSDDDDEDDDETPQEAPMKSSKGAPSASASTANKGAGMRSSAGASNSRVPSSLRVAVIFDPDNDDIRDCSLFIQPFFMNTRECSDSQNPPSCPKVCWILPVSLREDFVRLKLPEQLAATDFEGRAIALPSDTPNATPNIAPVNEFARIALRWGATWFVVRAPGGVLPRSWLTATHVALSGASAAARVGGMLIVDVAWHRKNVIGSAPGFLVPDSVDPKSAWYYWLLQVYPAALVYKLDAPEESVADVDKVMVACEEAQFAAIRDAIKKK